MIPTYNPRADYLEETLKSVLQQDPGPVKSEMTFYKWVRETDEEVQRLRGQLRVVEASYSYRLGRALLAPLRLLRKLWRRFSLRRCK